jgi:putative transcriptional regulator
MAKKTKTSRLTKELLETAGEMRKVGLLSRAAHEKITMRLVALKGTAAPAPAQTPFLQ